MPKTLTIVGLDLKHAEQTVVYEWGKIFGKYEELLKQTAKIGDLELSNTRIKKLVKEYIVIKNRQNHLKTVVKQEWETAHKEPFPSIEKAYEEGWALLKKMYDDAANAYEKGERYLVIPTLSTFLSKEEVLELIKSTQLQNDMSDDEVEPIPISTNLITFPPETPMRTSTSATNKNPIQASTSAPIGNSSVNMKPASNKRFTVEPRPSLSKYDPKRVREIAEFSGDIIQYQTFRTLYKEIVENTDASDATKLSILYQKLEGQPLELISSYIPSQVDQAILALDIRYSHAISIRMHVKSKTENLTYLKHREDLDDFMKMIGEIRAIGGMLDTIRADSSFENDICVMICTKFPYYITDHYIKTSLLGYYKINSLIHHLDKELEVPMARHLTGIGFSKPKYNVPNTNRQEAKQGNARRIRGNNTVNAVQAEKNEKPSKINYSPKEQTIELPCSICESKNHTAVFCTRIPFAARLKLVEEYKLCRLCLEEGHNVDNCRFNDILCPICNNMHNKVICSNRYGTWKPKQNNYSQNNAPRRQAYTAFEDTLASLFKEDEE